jgi:uncharacterized protein YkwD
MQLHCSNQKEVSSTRGVSIKSHEFDAVKSTDGVQLLEFPCDLSENPDQKFTFEELTALGKYSLSLINGERAFFPKEGNNAAPLQWSDALWKVAICHARDMCERDFFDHTNPDGEGPFARIDRAIGTVYTAYAENISTSFNSAFNYQLIDVREAAAKIRHLSYMDECVCNEGCTSGKKAGHRINILNNAYTHVGVGAWFCKRNQKWYEAQNFWRLEKNADDTNAYCAKGVTSNPPERFSKYRK